jgi:L-alanine-DL-glutamate epimerase-like enolase superfamily enzyme
LLGARRAYPKIPYFSLLFGDDPQETCDLARKARADGFRAVKFGWGPFGRGSVAQDIDLVKAAREGLGREGILCIDAGTIWGTDVKSAARLDVLRNVM